MQTSTRPAAGSLAHHIQISYSQPAQGSLTQELPSQGRKAVADLFEGLLCHLVQQRKWEQRNDNFKMVVGQLLSDQGATGTIAVAVVLPSRP